MHYNIDEIEDQLIATVKADPYIISLNALVDTNAGDISTLTFLNPAELEGLIPRTPFVLIQYQGVIDSRQHSSSHDIYINTIAFRFYVGAQSMRRTKESQRSYAYPMLRGIYDAIHGKVPLMDASVQSQQLSGIDNYLTASPDLPNGIATVGFNPITGFQKRGGQDERLMVNMKRLVVYQTDYKIMMLA